ncbi:hypothetical protein EMIT0P395_100079 [Pseudomonas sp. IT-P395]
MAQLRTANERKVFWESLHQFTYFPYLARFFLANHLGWPELLAGVWIAETPLIALR